MHNSASYKEDTIPAGVKMPSEALYLSQSYQDTWDDYERSLKLPSFPVWDLVIITASNPHQAEAFRAQIESRRNALPERTKYLVIPDEGGVRVGSGGATLSVLKVIREQVESFAGQRILVIHSGGDSKRVPQYSALGKLFSPVPHELPDGRNSTLFDEFLIAMSSVPGRIREGMLLLSGDVLLLFNPLLVDYPGHGAACISFKENVETGKNHGVYLRGEDGYVEAFLHKQTAETLRKAGAVNEHGAVDIDTGAVIFGTDVLDALWGLISTDGVFDEIKYHSLVNSRVRLSLYGDFQYPMAASSTLEQFYSEKPEGAFCPELKEARTLVWNALRPFRMKLLRLAPAKFIHFGTTGEILALMCGGVDEYRELGWKRIVNSSWKGRAAGYNSVLSPEAEIGENCFLEVSHVHGGAKVGSGSILSYIDVHRGEEIPGGVVLHGLKQLDKKFVCRIYGVEDNPKENRLFGKEIPEAFGASLWDAELYPECDTIKDAVAAALAIYAAVSHGRWGVIAAMEHRKSLCSGFNDADPAAILAWNGRMAELVKMNSINAAIDAGTPVSQLEGKLAPPLTTIQRQWKADHIARADYGRRMRLHYYIGTAMRDDAELSAAFASLSRAIQEETLAGLEENKAAHITRESHEVRLPLRVNWGGGWSDTPPYCNENGGTVLNSAILLQGERPVSVRIMKTKERRIVFDSRDMDVHGEFDNIEPLQRVGDPFDPFVLQKAALLTCGVIPAQGGDLQEILDRLGGGFRMDTQVNGVPKGSGLGTSSILAAACVKCLFEFLNIPHMEADLYSHVLVMEQIMTTGGGWQDQVGGVTDGIKYITSRPGLKQKLTVAHLHLDEGTRRELNERFVLIYTGQRRLARNLLRDVVGRYIGNEKDTVYALNEIQRIAALMRFELERGHVDDFAALLSRHWELSKMIDSGSTNTLIDQIFDSVDSMLDGKMVCGAGGGGFLQGVMKKGITRKMLQDRLKEVFQDTDISVWDCELV